MKCTPAKMMTSAGGASPPGARGRASRPRSRRRPAPRGAGSCGPARRRCGAGPARGSPPAARRSRSAVSSSALDDRQLEPGASGHAVSRLRPGRRIVEPAMAAAALPAAPGGLGDEPGDEQLVAGCARRRRASSRGQPVQLLLGVQQRGLGALHADVGGHESRASRAGSPRSRRRRRCRARRRRSRRAPAAAAAGVRAGGQRRGRRGRRTPAPRAASSRRAGWRRARRCEATSPTAQSPGRLARPSRSVWIPPMA